MQTTFECIFKNFNMHNKMEKQVELILWVYFIYPNISKYCYFNTLLMRYFIDTKFSKSSVYFNTKNLSIWTAIFQIITNHMWLLVCILDSTALEDIRCTRSWPSDLDPEELRHINIPIISVASSGNLLIDIYVLGMVVDMGLVRFYHNNFF